MRIGGYSHTDYSPKSLYYILKSIIDGNKIKIFEYIIMIEKKGELE
jgi:hypothetical protein